MFQKSDKGLLSFKGIKIFRERWSQVRIKNNVRAKKIDLQKPEQLFLIEYGPSFKAYA